MKINLIIKFKVGMEYAYFVNLMLLSK